MHDVFAATRIWQLHHVQHLPKHATATGQRLFGKERHHDAWKGQAALSDARERLLDYTYNILHSADFYDDPSDNIRTISNMEVATITYIDKRLEIMDSWQIYVEDKKNPNCLVGIEQVFDVTLFYDDSTHIRYIGTLDGLCYVPHKEAYFLEENKTASRLDEGWRQSFEMVHQITGYCACSTALFGFLVLNAHVFGLKLKPTGREDIHNFQVRRDLNAITHWANWVYYTVKLYEQFRDDFENAPRFTHSCNRYFRPCSLIPFCADTPEGRQEQWEDMEPAPLSPSEQAVQELF